MYTPRHISSALLSLWCLVFLPATRLTGHLLSLNIAAVHICIDATVHILHIHFWCAAAWSWPKVKVSVPKCGH